MVFSSLAFLYAFLPVTVCLYFICRGKKWRNGVLLVVSLIFYSWGEPKYLLLLLGASLIAYLCGLLIDFFQKTEKYGCKKTALIFGIVLLTGNLLFFKYLNFFSASVSRVFSVSLPIPQITLPIGISFYTFQILSYIIDLYRGKVHVQKNFFYLTLYVSFFPQLIAGPIVRYETIEQEITQRHESLDGVAKGIKRFICGLAKKVVIANNVALIAEIIRKGDPSIYGSFFYWIAAIAYALQIYFDFSGYSDMAIGLGEIFGFHFLENFDAPYCALSITDFWRRWHISLSSWFRDYIYIPLGGNRVSKVRWIFNILVVWGLTGFWHGAQWNFLVWGLYYGIILLIEKIVLGKRLEKTPKAIRWIYTMVLVLVGWVIFDSANLMQMFSSLAMLFNFTPTDFVNAVTADTAIARGLIYIPLGILCCLPVWKKFLPKMRGKGTVALIIEDGVYVGLLLLSIVFLLSTTYNPFIYFRF